MLRPPGVPLTTRTLRAFAPRDEERRAAHLDAHVHEQLVDADVVHVFGELSFATVADFETFSSYR